MEEFLAPFIDWTIDLVRHNGPTALCVVFLLAFGESLAFFSLLLPASVILFALGALIGKAEIAFWPIWLAAAVGAVAGMMVAPIVFLDPNMMGGVLLYAFAGALVGGIENPFGAVIGGFLVGVLENVLGA